MPRNPHEGNLLLSTDRYQHIDSLHPLSLSATEPANQGLCNLPFLSRQPSFHRFAPACYLASVSRRHLLQPISLHMASQSVDGWNLLAQERSQLVPRIIIPRGISPKCCLCEVTASSQYDIKVAP